MRNMRILRRYVLCVLATALVSLAGSPASATPVSANGLTGALLKAGGGAGTFSSVRAFGSMIGDSALQSELSKLRKQYTGDDVDFFVEAFDFTMQDAWLRAGQSDIAVPSQPISGKALALSLVDAGTSFHMFTTRRMLGELLTPKLRNDVMNDLTMKYSPTQTDTFIRIGNQFFYDVAQLLGDQSVALSPNH
jgi:hypothetical protein